MKFITIDQVISKTSMSRSYIMACRGGFPPGRKIEGKRGLVWIDTEIEKWMMVQVAVSNFGAVHYSGSAAAL